MKKRKDSSSCHCEDSSSCHCEERSDEAISSPRPPKIDNRIKSIENEVKDWIDERKRNLRKLAVCSKPEDKIRLEAQIDFLSIVEINILKILRRAKL